MPLPTPGPSDVWGAALNAWLLAEHSPFTFTLSASTSAGASTLTASALPTGIATNLGYLVIDPFTIQCEIRKVTGIAGSVLTLNGALTWAHASGDIAFFLGDGAVSLAWFGAKGDGSADDEPAIQAALDETTSNGGNLWVEGQNKTYLIKMPIVGGRSAKLRHAGLKASATYAPADTTNAMIVPCQGNIRSFTASAATDIITAINHGIPGDGVGVIFKGSSLPTGLVAGRVYFARDRLTDSFKVAATPGGAAINLTADGSGTAYCEATSLCKMWMTDVFVNANGVSGVNCVLGSWQQPSEMNKLRCDNSTGYGYAIGGQQATHYNFESINCSKALVLGEQAVLVGSCSFMWFYGFNAEQCDKGIYVDAGAAENCLFSGAHFEMNNGSGYSTTTSIAVDIAYGCNALIIDNVSVSMQASGQTFMKVATGVTTSYQLRSARWSGGMSSTGQTFLNDIGRGHNFDQWDDFRGKIASLDAPSKPSSFLYTDPHPIIILGYNGRWTGLGSTIDSEASIRLHPGSSQTGDQIRADNTSGTQKYGLTPTGHIKALDGVSTLVKAGAPVDGDFGAAPPNGTLAVDSTNNKIYVRIGGTWKGVVVT